MPANDPAFNLEAVLRDRPRHDPPTFEDWRARDALRLAGHLLEKHPGAEVPDPECSTCAELVHAGWQGTY